jgi:hypothetical protein
MNPHFTEISTMTITSPFHSFVRAFTARSRVPSHPEVLQEHQLTIPRRIDEPASAASVARELLRNRREDITLVLYLDERHRFVGHAIVAVGWVQEARLGARPILYGGESCRASECILVRYRRYGAVARRKKSNAPSDPSRRAVAAMGSSWSITWL